VCWTGFFFSFLLDGQIIGVVFRCLQRRWFLREGHLAIATLFSLSFCVWLTLGN
jgi:hypothetical protein